MHFIIPGNSFTYVFYLYLYYTILIRLPLSLAIVTGWYEPFTIRRSFFRVYNWHLNRKWLWYFWQCFL